MNSPALFAVQIQHISHLADDIIGLTLVHPDGEPLPPFAAGAHIDLQLPNGLLRQYSLCNDPADRSCYRLGILREPDSRGGSASAHEDLKAGEQVMISKPRNLFALVEAEHSVLLAGGIGITPMLAMAQELAAQGRSFELHYSARSRSRAAFLDVLEQSPWADRVHLHLDDEGGSALQLDAVLEQHAGRQVYICGPAGFIDFLDHAARAYGWAAEQIHIEQFSAPELEPDSDAPEPGSFEIQIASSGQLITVSAGQTAYQALKAAGVEVCVSCEQGICGSCLTPLLEGEPDHRDHFQTDAEKAANTHFSPCCSRAHSARLVLDL